MTYFLRTCVASKFTAHSYIILGCNLSKNLSAAKPDKNTLPPQTSRQTDRQRQTHTHIHSKVRHTPLTTYLVVEDFKLRTAKSSVRSLKFKNFKPKLFKPRSFHTQTQDTDTHTQHGLAHTPNDIPGLGRL